MCGSAQLFAYQIAYSVGLSDEAKQRALSFEAQDLDLVSELVTVKASARGENRRVEDQVVLGAGIHRGGIASLCAAARELSAGDDLQARDVCRVAVPFPTD